MKKGILYIVVLFLTVTGTFAQPDNAPVETIDGKKYYVHVVEGGNTLYGIHKLYNTDLEKILTANEGLTNDLTIGQRILIPIDTKDQTFYGKHIVKEGETLYGISRKYNCSIDDLKNLNKGLSDGISPGQEIIIPKSSQGGGQVSEVIQSDPVVENDLPTKDEYAISIQDSVIKHTVLAHETLYSISKRYMVSADTIMSMNQMRNHRVRKGDVLLIPVKNVNYEIIEKDLGELNPPDTIIDVVELTEFKKVYQVALLLPLMLDRNDREMSKPLKLDQVREMYSTTKIAFDFYQGFIMAADSLSQAGVSLDIYVYDTKNDTSAIKQHFNKPEFATMDLVVGPLYRNTINYTAKLCAQKQIRMVLPFSADADVLYENPYVYKGGASNMTLMDGIVDYVIANHKHHNILLIKPTSAGDLALYERVKARFNEKIKMVEGAYNTQIVEVGMGSSSGRDLNAYLKKDTTNIFIIPSTSLTYVSGAMSRLNKVMNMNPYAKNLKTIAFGLEDWNRFEDLDLKYRNRMNQHYASYRFLDYNEPQTIEFVKAFRKSYGTDPSVFSTQGFDYGMYFLSALHLYGTNFDLSIASHQMDLIQNDFRFRKIDMNSGRENQNIFIVKYSNYTLVRMK